MAQIPTPPASRDASEAPEASPKLAGPSSDLLQSLDLLLERYLKLLDHYQALQMRLEKQLSSGFFSLAQANCLSSPGRRYGEHCYDERMKATRKILLQQTSPSASLDWTSETELGSGKSNQSCGYSYIFKIKPATTGSPVKEAKDRNGTIEPSTTSPQCQSSNSGTGHQIVTGVQPSSTPLKPTVTESTSSSAPPSPKEPFRPSDPISWYGILVPPSLRNAQKSFTIAMVDYVPELASVITEMRKVEDKVDKLRSETGLVKSHRRTEHGKYSSVENATSGTDI